MEDTEVPSSGDRSFCAIGDGLLGVERRALMEIGLRLIDLAGKDPAAMERDQLAGHVAAMATDTELVGAVAGRFMDHGDNVAASVTVGEKSMVSLVNAKGRVSRTRATQLSRAGRAIHRFPSFHTALMAGRITTGHTDLMHTLARRCNSDQLNAAEKDLAALAVLCTPEEFRDHLAVWEAAADPTEHLDKFLKAEASRHFWWARDLFGNTHFGGCFDPISGEQVIDTLLARQKQLESQNPDLKGGAAAHDALVDLILNPDQKGKPGARIEFIAPGDGHHTPDHGFDQHTSTHPEPDIDVPEATEADLVEFVRDQSQCAQIEGFLHFARFMTGRQDPVPPAPMPGRAGFSSIIYPKTAAGTLIPPAVLNRYRPSATIRTNRIDRSGQLTDDKPGGRHFTDRQKRLTRLRDNYCQHPGCRMPGRWTEHDHINPHSKGGPTLVTNAQLLCSFHHKWKHRDDPHGSKVFDNSPIRIE